MISKSNTANILCLLFTTSGKTFFGEGKTRKLIGWRKKFDYRKMKDKNNNVGQNVNLIKWIFFDIGGVLLDDSIPEKRRLDILFEIAKKYNPDTNYHDMNNTRIKMSSKKGNLSINILKYLIPDSLNFKKAKEEYNSRKSKIRYYEDSKIRPETKDVLFKLAQRYQLGLIANQSVLAKEKLEKAGVYGLLHHQTVSDEHSLAKPDPKYFQAVFRETGAIPSKSALVDDNIERGLIQAKKLGMITVCYKFQDRYQMPNQYVDFTITSLTDLLKIFN